MPKRVQRLLPLRRVRFMRDARAIRSTKTVAKISGEDSSAPIFKRSSQLPFRRRWNPAVVSCILTIRSFPADLDSKHNLNLWAGSVELINASLIAPGYQFGGDTYEFAFDVYAIAPVADGFFMSISLWNNLYTPLEDRDTYLAVEYDDTSLHLYTLNDGNGNGKQTVVLAAQQWHHIVQRCVFNNNVTANDDCFLYVNGSLVITFTSWRQYHVANAVQSGGNLAETSEPHNFVEFRLSRDPSFYGKSVTAVKGVQIDNFEQSIYNSTNPSSFYRYSTSFDVADSNVNGCERYPVLNGGTCVLPGGTAIGSNGTRLAQCSTGFGGPSCEFALVC